jgi:uncharacterized protein (DUF697 family)
MTPINWSGVCETLRDHPHVEWNILFQDGEQAHGTITHLPAGSPDDWANDAVFHLKAPNDPASIGASRRVDQVLRCTPAETEPNGGLRGRIKGARREVEGLGGWAAFKSGEWVLSLVRRSFRNYYERANEKYFRAKYPGKDVAFIVKNLASVAARNAMMLGALTGAAVTTDEIVTLMTAAEGGIGLPANIAIAAAAIAAESVTVLRIQLQLVAELARLYGTALDPEDPEDILTILAFALGGSAAEAAGKFGMKVGGKMAAKAVKGVVSKEVLKSVQSIGMQIGVKILQKQLVKYTVPLASVGIGAGWNYFSTHAIAKIATNHLIKRRDEQWATP